MTPRKIRATEVDRGCYQNYMKKAKEFYGAMLYSEKQGYWNAVGLNAVHRVISTADALLVRYAGIRSIDTDHMLAVDLMRQKINIRGIDEKINSCRRILAKKSLIEYDNSVFSQRDAIDILKQAERFYVWAMQELSSN